MMITPEESLQQTITSTTDDLIQQSTKLMMMDEKIREQSIILKQANQELDDAKMRWIEHGQAVLHKQRLMNKLEHKVEQVL